MTANFSSNFHLVRTKIVIELSFMPRQKPLTPPPPSRPPRSPFRFFNRTPRRVSGGGIGDNNINRDERTPLTKQNQFSPLPLYMIIVYIMIQLKNHQ